MSKERPTVYLAGPLNSPDAPGYLDNVHQFLVWHAKLLKLGFSVYNPALDFVVGMMVGGMEYEDYFGSNFAFIKRCDAFFLIEHSPGADREWNEALDNCYVYTALDDDEEGLAEMCECFGIPYEEEKPRPEPFVMRAAMNLNPVEFTDLSDDCINNLITVVTRGYWNGRGC